jgi:hypothetical protein
VKGLERCVKQRRKIYYVKCSRNTSKHIPLLYKRTKKKLKVLFILYQEKRKKKKKKKSAFNYGKMCNPLVARKKERKKGCRQLNGERERGRACV